MDRIAIAIACLLFLALGLPSPGQQPLGARMASRAASEGITAPANAARESASIDIGFRKEPAPENADVDIHVLMVMGHTP